MEESVKFEFSNYIEEELGLQKVDAASYSPLVLAYIGDCIYDLIFKTIVIIKCICQVYMFHEERSRYVQASSQSLMMRRMQEHLTEEEHAVYRRGRNAKSVSPAKNQSITDYRRATGFEALLGYLYLNRQYKRIMDLVKIGLEHLESEDGKTTPQPERDAK